MDISFIDGALATVIVAIIELTIYCGPLFTLLLIVENLGEVGARMGH